MTMIWLTDLCAGPTLWAQLFYVIILGSATRLVAADDKLAPEPRVVTVNLGQNFDGASFMPLMLHKRTKCAYKYGNIP